MIKWFSSLMLMLTCLASMGQYTVIVDTNGVSQGAKQLTNNAAGISRSTNGAFALGAVAPAASLTWTNTFPGRSVGSFRFNGTYSVSTPTGARVIVTLTNGVSETNDWMQGNGNGGIVWTNTLWIPICDVGSVVTVTNIGQTTWTNLGSTIKGI